MAESDTTIWRCCTKCGIAQYPKAFHKRPDLPDGLQTVCKSCVNAQRLEYRQNNKERLKTQKRAYYEKNKDRILAKNDRWRRDNPEQLKASRRKAYGKRKTSVREWNLQHNYKISLIEFNEMFILQDGRCAICKRHQSELSKALHVDHDHKTGDVRGLLCAHCNLALGGFRDDMSRLKQAIVYLENHHARK